MGNIHVLDFSVANLIAAGEVVDRPASVVKELLENAIDAKSTKVTVDIRGGGVGMIRVADNGCGMSAEDLPISLRRHATSKIRTAEDLAAIGTLGFRGEALAAIASVSDLHIITKRKEDETGHVLTAHCGQVISVEEVGCADGTTVLVEQLFDNVPARRKFLKRDATEAQAVSAFVEKVALSRPHISFSLSVDGNRRFITPGNGKIIDTLHALYGQVAARMIPVKGDTLGIRVYGYVGRSDATRNNRAEQNFFLNGRYIRSRTMMAALERAYSSFIAPERFPICALYMELDPRAVDINVHPAKLEVKFSDEHRVFEAVYYAVRAALEDNTERPDLDLSAARKQETRLEQKGDKLKQALSFMPEEVTQVTVTEQVKNTQAASLPKPPPSPAAPISRPQSAAPLRPTQVPVESAGSVSRPHGDMAAEPIAASAPIGIAAKPSPLRSPSQTPAVKEEAPPLPTYRLLGVLFDCYIVLELEGHCLLIDQHAAHERILFEELKQKQAQGQRLSQELMLPLTVRLTAEEFGAACEYRADLEAVGLSFTTPKTEGDTVVYVTAIPNAVSPYDAENLLVRMTDELVCGMGEPAVTESLRRERALYQVACKAAIKGGRRYDQAHIEWLCRKILVLPDITVCPHGRPIAIKLTKAELDRQFRRI